MLAGEPIRLFNHGKHTRDFTYVEDIVEGVLRTSDQPAQPDPKLEQRQPRSVHQRSPLAPVQYWQQQPGEPGGLRERAGSSAWRDRQTGVAAPSAWGCTGYLRGQQCAERSGGVSAGDAGGRGRGAVCGVVSGVLWLKAVQLGISQE